MHQPPSRLVLACAISIAILAVSTASIFIRFAQADAPSLAVAALRLAFASVLLAPVAWTRYRPQLLELSRRDLALGVISGLFLGLHFAAWISSLEYTTVASSVVLVSTGPLWVALLSPLFLGEKLPSGAIAGLGSALLGGIVVALFGGCDWQAGVVCDSVDELFRAQGLRGDLLALAGAWAVTGYLMIGRRMRTKIDLVPYIYMVYTVAALSLLIAMFILRVPALGFRPVTYLWLLLLALVPQLVGHSTYNWALRFLPAALVAVLTLGEPLGSATLAYFFLGERPTVFVILGGMMILAGIFLGSPASPWYGAGMMGVIPMKLPAHIFLDELGIGYQVREFPPETEKGAAPVARVLGFPEQQAVKTLIFQAGTRECVLVMLGGDQSAVSANLKRVIGSRDVRMAAPEIVKQTTGYVIGSIPPFGWQPPGFRSFLEQSLLAEPILGVGAGRWGQEIMIAPQDLLRATNAQAVDLVSPVPKSISKS